VLREINNTNRGVKRDQPIEANSAGEGQTIRFRVKRLWGGGRTHASEGGENGKQPTKGAGYQKKKRQRPSA